ncbi:MAG: alanine--glyoxylate aminotransferase family protein [Thermaerobacter sp.]|nr:alanine--glyoxylate aminotransferase [Bacillota bacterium]
MTKVDQLPQRLLLGPGPSEVHPRVLRALATPVLGHLDPAFLALMDQVQADLREVFGTTNLVTLPLSGTGTAGMEAAIVNLVEPGDRVVVGIAGAFGERMAEIAGRCGAEVVRVETPWGRPVDPDDLRRAAAGGADVIALVHAETSTGVLQPLEPVAEVAREAGALLLVDCVTSLGGIPVDVDRIGIDIAYSASQKCLGAPPGLAPITVSPRALERIERRTRPVPSWYLDLRLLTGYWREGGSRRYHHTAPISSVYALAEALVLLKEEGLEARWERQERLGRALQAGLEAMGLELFAAEGHRLPMLTTVRVPEGVDDAAIRRGLLEVYGIEIAGGLGAVAGQIWRIGLMGAACRPRAVLSVLAALDDLLAAAGFRFERGAGVAAAAAAMAGSAPAAAPGGVRSSAR